MIVVTPEQLRALVREAVSEAGGAKVHRVLLDRREIATVLGVGPDTVDEWRELGMPEVKVTPGAHPRFIAADCVEWARNRRCGA